MTVTRTDLDRLKRSLELFVHVEAGPSIQQDPASAGVLVEVTLEDTDYWRELLVRMFAKAESMSDDEFALLLRMSGREDTSYWSSVTPCSPWTATVVFESVAECGGRLVWDYEFRRMSVRLTVPANDCGPAADLLDKYWR